MRRFDERRESATCAARALAASLATRGPRSSASPATRQINCRDALLGSGVMVIALLCIGCRPWSYPGQLQPRTTDERSPATVAPSTNSAVSSPTAPSTSATEASLPADLVADLADDRWVRVVIPATDTSAVNSRWQWRHERFEQVDFQTVDVDTLARALDDERSAAATNAAILLARQGDARGTTRLTAAVADRKLRLPVRRVAAEALGAVDNEAVAQQLRALLDVYGRPNPPPPGGYSPELHADLLAALARQSSTTDEPHFLAGLRAEAATVRLAALATWQRANAAPLPEMAADLRTDSDPRIRAAALRLLSSRQNEHALDYLRTALDDHAWEVRLAAIESLGARGDDDARSALRTALRRNQPGARPALVAALLQAGDDQAWRTASDDSDWQVRLAVARALDGNYGSRERELARRFLTDRSTAVQHRTVQALDSWPLPEAGELLLLAVERSAYATRRMAAEQLRRRWPEAHEYAVDLPRERHDALLAELRTRWQTAYGMTAAATSPAPTTPERTTPVDEQLLRRVAELCAGLHDAAQARVSEAQALDELRAVGAALPEALAELATRLDRPVPALVYDQVLIDLGAEFRALVDLRSADVLRRRQAATVLGRLAEEQPLSVLTVRRMADLGCADSDGATVRLLIEALQTRADEPVVRLARVATAHQAAEVRRAACLYLAAHPSVMQASELLPLVRDSHPGVVLAALRALGHPGLVDDPSSIEKLLVLPDRELRLAVAVCLYRQRAASGLYALERLAHDDSAEIRRATVQAVGNLAVGNQVDDTLVPLLIGLLDDVPPVRDAVLVALAACAPSAGIAASRDQLPVPAEEQVAAWRRWAANRR